MAKKQVTIPIFIPHQGCPHRCVFCNQWQTTGIKALPDKEYITEKIRSHLSRIAPSVERIEAAFFGGSFTGIPAEYQRELLGAAREFLESGRIHGIRLSTRPDYIDAERLSLLKQFGVDTVELGVQSFSDRVLDAAGRGHDAAAVFRAVALLRERGFRFVIQLMPGLPGDTMEESLRSAETAAGLEPDGVRVYPAVVLRGTGLAALYESKAYSPLTLGEAVEVCSRMQLVFNRSGIPVIRMGLHPFDPAEEKNILAGPYHPSFGYLVKSRLRRGEMEEKISSSLREDPLPSGGAVTILLPFKAKEECLGHRKENMSYLREKFNDLTIHYRISGREDIVIERCPG